MFRSFLVGSFILWVALAVVGCNAGNIASRCGSVDCGPNGTCIEESTGPACRCDPGFQPDGLRCVPLPEVCQDVSCGSHGSCVDNAGEPACDCDAGYLPEGLTCVQEPDACQGVDCGLNGRCFDDGGSPACNCDPGFLPEGLTCVPEPPPCDFPECGSLGIRLTHVDVNQGVQTRIVDDGLWNDPTPSHDAGHRMVAIVGGRPALFQAFWELEAGFEARDIRAVLTLTQADDSETVLTDTKHLSTGQVPSMGSFSGTFSWLVNGAGLRADTRFDILFEDVNDVGAGTYLGSRFPEEGEQALGAIGDPMTLKVVVIPQTGCGADPQTFGPDEQQDMIGMIFNTYPVAALEIVFHDVVTTWNCPPDIWSEVSGLRDSENLGPEWYYAVVLSRQQSNGDGFGTLCGVSQSCDRTHWSGAMGARSFPNTIHELGHNHGRDHTFEDSDYLPSGGGADGDLDTWGYGLVPGNHPSDSDMQGLFFDPDEYYDLMSYTLPWSNQWVGAYTYRGFTDRVQLVSSWSGSGKGAGLERFYRSRSVHGTYAQDGSFRWRFTVGGDLPQEQILDQDNQVEFSGPTAPKGLFGIRSKRASDGTVGGLVFSLPPGTSASDIESFQGRLAGQPFQGLMKNILRPLPRGPADPSTAPGTYRVVHR